MTLGEKRCSNVYNGQIVSREGFTQKTAASVATGNCLRSGGHLSQALRKPSMPQAQPCSTYHLTLPTLTR